jgi:hypothetical protein
MINKIMISLLWSLIPGVFEYLYGLKVFSTGFYEVSFSGGKAIIEHFNKNALRSGYAGIWNLKNIKEATTTKKFFDIHTEISGWIAINLHSLSY